MPYASEAQRRWAHTPAGTKALGGKAKVLEWDEASKGLKLPERVKKAESTLQLYLDKIADLAASNAIATYTGAKKPSAPVKPTGPNANPKGPGSSQKSFTPNTPSSDTVVNDALTQNSLASGSQKIDTGASLPITT